MTVSSMDSLQLRTRSMTRSRGAAPTGSSLMATIWSPGISFPSEGPPGVTERTTTGFSLPATNPKPRTGSLRIATVRGAGGRTGPLSG